MAKRDFVSLNQPVGEALREQKELESKGYVVIESYGNDFDMGIVLEDATGKDKEEVIKRHDDYFKYVEERKNLGKKFLVNEK